MTLLEVTVWCPVLSGHFPTRSYSTFKELITATGMFMTVTAFEK